MAGLPDPAVAATVAAAEATVQTAAAGASTEEDTAQGLVSWAGFEGILEPEDAAAVDKQALEGKLALLYSAQTLLDAERADYARIARPAAAEAAERVYDETEYTHVKMVALPSPSHASPVWDASVLKARHPVQSASQQEAQHETTLRLIVALTNGTEPVAEGFTRTLEDSRMGTSDSALAEAVTTARVRVLTANMPHLTPFLGFESEVQHNGETLGVKFQVVDSPCKPVTVTLSGIPASWGVLHVLALVLGLHQGEVRSASLKQVAAWQKVSGRRSSELEALSQQALAGLSKAGMRGVVAPARQSGTAVLKAPPTTWRYDTTLRQARICPSRFEVRTKGSGPNPIILLQGEGISSCSKCDSRQHLQFHCKQRVSSRPQAHVNEPLTLTRLTPETAASAAQVPRQHQ